MGSSVETVSYVGSVFSRFSFVSVIDILIVALLFYWFYTLIRETHAVQIIYGILFLVIIWLLAKTLHLNTLIFILQSALTAIIVAIPVVFQPELRNALVKLGRTKLTSEFKELTRTDLEKVLDIISNSVDTLAKQKIGAIIVLARSDRLKELVDKSKLIDARLSEELLLNIFTPLAPLHDGAVIIAGSKIKAAGAILPLSDKKLNLQFGTRHRAAIGLSSVSDAVIIVTSEETGNISMAVDGVLQRNLEKQDLKADLYKLLNLKNKQPGPPASITNQPK